MQRQLYQSKCTEFWLSTANSCGHNPRALWRAVDMLLQPPTHAPQTNYQPSTLPSSSEATSTVYGRPPVIVSRKVPPLRHIEPATVTEILSLLKNTPPKTCALDPIPTWSLKQDAQLSQRDRAAGCVIVFAKSRRLHGRQYFTDLIGLSLTTVT